jgi:hypothetical protein
MCGAVTVFASYLLGGPQQKLFTALSGKCGPLLVAAVLFVQQYLIRVSAPVHILQSLPQSDPEGQP